MSNRTLKYLSSIIFLLALLVWGGVGILYFTTDFWMPSKSKTSISTPSQSSLLLSSAVFTDESGLFSLKYDSQRYSVEKQAFNLLSAMPTPWISGIPQEKSALITINRLVDKSGQIFSFYLEDIPFEEKKQSLGKRGFLFEDGEIAFFPLQNVEGYKLKRTVHLPKAPDEVSKGGEKERFFISYLYFFPINQGGKTLVLTTSTKNMEIAEKIVKDNLSLAPHN